MLRRILALAALALVVGGGVAGAQSFSARRMAMGGAILAGGGTGGSVVNVAYRAVPAAPESTWAIPLPIGLVQLMADPPEFDPDQPEFNIYEMANLFYNPPWNWQLRAPPVPANDVYISVGKDQLVMDLGEVTSVFPPGPSEIASVYNGPELGFSVRRFFLAAAPLVYYENELTMNDALQGAIEGEEFRPNTHYEMLDRGNGMAAAGAHLGWAGPIVQQGDPRGGGMGLYAGARVKLMRGLAYGSTDNSTAFTTGDEIFATAPVEIGYAGHHYDAGPDGGGFGGGLDLGAVWVARGVEVGVGVNDIGTSFDWRVEETVGRSDPVTGDYVTTVVAHDRPLTSKVPTTAAANVATRVGRFLVAGDVVRGVRETTGHVGAETWLGRGLALRAGASYDENEMIQGSAGAGFRVGAFGVDLAVASHSRNLSRERGLELGAGLAFYR